MLGNSEYGLKNLLLINCRKLYIDIVTLMLISYIYARINKNLIKNGLIQCSLKIKINVQQGLQIILKIISRSGLKLSLIEKYCYRSVIWKKNVVYQEPQLKKILKVVSWIV